MSGALRVIGVGPGDPELLTLKAVRLINESQVLCVPRGREEGSSLALSIAAKAVNLDGKEIMEAYFPMKKTKQQRTQSAKARKRASAEVKKSLELSNSRAYALIEDERLDNKWNETAGDIARKLNEGKNVAFLTLGDPTIYSTFFYVYDRLLELQPDLPIEIIPGVSSINASAARASLSLGLADEQIAILPANYLQGLGDTLQRFDTVVLVKVNKVWNEIMRLLSDMDLAAHATCISRAGMEDERIFHDIRDVRQEDLHYFSLVIVRK
jgi:precorrin-2/cobalt-factor-2 C20-methyltransferase